MPRGIPKNLGITDEERLRAKGWVVTNESCWEWLGTRHNKKGYGEVRLVGRTELAHRVSYRVFVDSNLDAAQIVCHICDNPICINPAHLYAGTQQSNSDDKLNRGRGVWLKGDAHPGAKLTVMQATEIWELRTSGIAGRVVGEGYGVSQSTVAAIWAGKIWRSVHEDAI